MGFAIIGVFEDGLFQGIPVLRGFRGHCNTADFEKFLFFFQASVYSICLRTCDDGMDGTEVFPDYPDLIADRSVYFMHLSQKAAACEMSQ